MIVEEAILRTIPRSLKNTNEQRTNARIAEVSAYEIFRENQVKELSSTYDHVN